MRHEVRPRHLLSSPLPRALETAWLVAEGCRKAPAGMAVPITSPIKPPAPLEPQIVSWLALLTPTAVALAGLVTWLAEHADAGLPCLVGHEPDLSALVAALVGAPRPPLRVRKASLSCLEFEAPGRAQLLWSLPCAHMRG
jgi:phosphohistidine phosphatase